MAWLIIFIAVAMVLAPITLMMPSPAQKKQAILRERARERGLMVNIVDLPQSHRQKVRQEAAQQGVSYTLRIARKKGQTRPLWFFWREEPLDEPAAGKIPPDAIFEELKVLREDMPADIVGLESTEAGYCVYWRERGSTDTVDYIAGLLSKVRELAGGEQLDDRT